MLRYSSCVLAQRQKITSQFCLIVRLMVIFGLLSGLVTAEEPARQIDLAGTWSLQLDPDDQGVSHKWFTRSFNDSVELPGSLQAQGFGSPPRLDSEWTGMIRPEVIQMPRYAPYRNPENFKMPFWLQPKRAYVGPAWYQRTVTIPSQWSGQHITLHLERCHWFTQVWIDEQLAGERESLSAPHEYDLTDCLTPGTHTITMRIDNRLHINVGHNAHSVSDHTQTNWNGIIGKLELRAEPIVEIKDIQVFPHRDTSMADVQLVLANHGDTATNVELCVTSHQYDRALGAVSKAVYLNQGTTSCNIKVPLTEDVKLWSEHAPHLCSLYVSLFVDLNTPEPLVRKELQFGVREITAADNQFLLNGQPVYFRGTLECCIFPLTGYPPTDVDAWKRIVKRCKEFGLNHIRFHSWCPPEAAFVAADELGFYYQVECAAWANGTASVGNGKPLDKWLYREADRILREYGNHPSFVLFAYGNEPSGPGPRRHGEDYLGPWVDHYKRVATRQLVTCAAGWPYIKENDFHVMHSPLRQRGVFNSQKPGTLHDYQKHVQAHSIPLISHETGQWCVFPNLKEMERYTGVLEAKNFEIVEDFLQAHGLAHRADDFLMASGQLQKLLYKEEIEVMLRTAGLGGFQLLDLHDFPGQGTALIGVLDPFWDPKPYVTAKQFHRFCGPVVPLARLESRTWTNDQVLRADIEVYQFGDSDLSNHPVTWTIHDDKGKSLGQGQWENVDLSPGGLRTIGQLKCPLAAINDATRIRLTVAIEQTPYTNDWDMWVYPPVQPIAPHDEIRITRSLDDETRRDLEEGGKVLLLPIMHTIKGDTSGSFEPIFWNRLWFPTQRVQTLGILCQPEHPALADFPTDMHSNWQWWDICNRCKPMILDELPTQLTPIIQIIDDWNTCRKLAMAFEVRVGKGKLLICSADLYHDLADRPVARQLRKSLLHYMSTDDFAPTAAVPLSMITSLFRGPTTLQRLEAKVTASSEQPGYEAVNAIDNRPDSLWHTAWGNNAPRHPHELVVDLHVQHTIRGLVYQGRSDMSNGRIAGFSIYVSRDGQQWGEPVARGTWTDSVTQQQALLPMPQKGRFVKLVAESEVNGQSFASVAELDVLLAD